jgi:nucleotide-binding universal stress UspA family protein
MFQRIVCATDFSDTAEAAWAVARDLAAVHRAELTLVHVFPDLPPSPDVAVPSVIQVWEEQKRWVDEELARRVADAASRGLRSRAVIKHGPAADGLVEAVTEAHGDLLVVGTHGRTGLERVLLGSVAEAVVRKAPCAVLTVKPRASERAQAAA